MSREPAPHTFIVESRELLRDMEAALLVLRQGPSDRAALDAVFRAAHTIKGSSGMFGFDAIVDFTHVLEGVMVELRGGGRSADEELVALLLAAADHLAAMIDCLEADDRHERLAALAAARPELARQLAAHAAPAAAASDAWHISVRFAPGVLREGMDPLALLAYLSRLGELAGVAVVSDALPSAADMDPECCYLGLELRLRTAVARAEIEAAFDYVRAGSVLHLLPPQAPLADYAALLQGAREGAQRMGEALLACGSLDADELASLQGTGSAAAPPRQAPAAGEAAPATAADPPPAIADATAARRATEHRFARVDADKLDDLINLVGELVIASAGMALGARRAGNGELVESAANLGRLVEEVRDRSLALRMVPIGETFGRFHRVVRDLGRTLGKEVELVVSGAETELDKSMVQMLNDPLMHLVRNAMDHGIEPPARRLQQGKPARGRLLLNAYHESGSIVIELADDGAGLDRQRILARALERGLVPAGHTPTDAEIQQLVLQPGFSTADAVTAVSGRGVGMDVVKRNVEALRGSLSIASEPGAGTRLALRVPLTLAIIDGFLVGVGPSAYVVPLELVVECLELPAGDAAACRGYLELRGEVLPLLRLRDCFGVGGEPGRRENIVVVQYAGQRAGFVVDTLLGEFQTVIKPLGKLFERLAGISGSTILGTGEVALILDVQALVDQAAAAEARRTAMRTAA